MQQQQPRPVSTGPGPAQLRSPTQQSFKDAADVKKQFAALLPMWRDRNLEYDTNANRRKRVLAVWASEKVPMRVPPEMSLSVTERARATPPWKRRASQLRPQSSLVAFGRKRSGCAMAHLLSKEGQPWPHLMERLKG